MISSVTAWIIPAIGVLAPARIFVAVRAIAPVAGIPPNNGEARLAMPCATSSTLELCLVPLMLSATTAESRLSTAARSATVMAEGNSGTTWSSRNAGMESLGKPVGIPPNLLPIVSRGMPSSATATVQPSIARIDPGIRFVTRGRTMIMARDAA